MPPGREGHAEVPNLSNSTSYSGSWLRAIAHIYTSAQYSNSRKAVIVQDLFLCYNEQRAATLPIQVYLVIILPAGSSNQDPAIQLEE